MKKMLLIVAFFGLIALPQLSHAEPYVSAYIGAAFPHDADITDKSGLGLTPTMEFDTGLTYGAKVGYWFTDQNAPFFGIQFDLNSYTTEATEKIDFSGVFGIPANAIAIGDVTVTSYTVNALLRAHEGNIRPYAGIGIGWFTGELDSATVTVNFPTFGISTTMQVPGEEDTRFGWQVLAGVDFIINPNLSIFGEYKYSRVDFEFSTTDVEYSASQVYGGVSYHF